MTLTRRAGTLLAEKWRGKGGRRYRTALLQLKFAVDESWLDYLIIGVYFVFVLGIGAVLRNKIG